MIDSDSQDLQDWHWITSIEGRTCVDRLALQYINESENQLLHAARGLLTPQRAALVVEQIRLRTRASKKFLHPDKWVWTAPLLEQATDQFTAEFVSSFYPTGSDVADLCCGAGSDAVALASKDQNLRCVDSSEIAVLIARSNLLSHGFTAKVTHGLAEEFSVAKNDWLHIDPDRRQSGNRVTKIEWVTPGPDQLEQLTCRSLAGSIKLAPATDPPNDWVERFGYHWISSERAVRQLRIWWGCSSFPNGTRSASFRDTQGTWHTLQRTPAAIEQARSSVSLTSRCDDWIADYDPAVRTANLTCSLAEEIQASVLESDTGYLTSQVPRTHPMVSWFRVIDVLAADTKKLRAYFKKNGVGILEIKQRGTGFDLEKLRRELKLSGDASKTLFFYRTGRSVQSVVAERVGKVSD